MRLFTTAPKKFPVNFPVTREFGLSRTTKKPAESAGSWVKLDLLQQRSVLRTNFLSRNYHGRRDAVARIKMQQANTLG